MTATQQALFFKRLTAQNEKYRYKLPSRQDAGKFIQNLINFLFPISKDCPSCPAKDLAMKYADLRNDLSCMLQPLLPQLERDTEEILD